MRILDADVAVDLQAGGGALLRLVCKTGEAFGVELSPAAFAALQESVAPAGATANPT